MRGVAKTSVLIFLFHFSCFCDDSHEPQQQLKQQDEGLDMLSKSADRLGALSLGISEELGHQNK